MSNRIPICAVAMLTMIGCAPKGAVTTQPATRAIVSPTPRANVARASADPAAPTRRLTQLDVYVLTVPAGAISGSDEFWKRVEENGIDPKQHDLLGYNGVRVGEASVDDWPKFKAIFDPYPVESKPIQIIGLEARRQQLAMSGTIPMQHIWCFTDSGELKGRTYSDCENFWEVSYQPKPLQGDYVLLSLCPAVRSVRKRLELVKHVGPGETQEREFAYVSPEYLLELSVSIEVPPGKFVIFAPTERLGEYSIGRTFLTDGTRGVPQERVLVLVPQLIDARQTTTGSPRAGGGRGGSSK